MGGENKDQGRGEKAGGVLWSGRNQSFSNVCVVGGGGGMSHLVDIHLDMGQLLQTQYYNY